MPTSEYNKWLIFLKDDEPDVTEIQLAVLSTLVSNGLGGKAKVKDFIISKEQKKETISHTGVSLESARSAFGALTTKKK